MVSHTSDRKGLGFILTGATSDDGKTRPIARFKCVVCDEFIDLSVKSSEILNPDSLVRSAINRGWEADPFRKSHVRCPKHANPHRAKNDTNSELRKLEAKMAAQPAPPSPSSPPSPIREPTADQRANVRKLIEAHFDEDLGYYLDGFTDEKIAVAINVPRIVVERIREAAYGPIKVSQEAIALRKEIGALRGDFANAESSAVTLFEQVRADLAAFGKRLDDLEARVGVLPAAKEQSR